MTAISQTAEEAVDNAEVMKTVYGILSKSYPTFDDGDDEWITNGLSDSPFRVVVSTALSTVTHSKRVIRACNDLFRRVDSFAELAALDDEELRELIRPVAHYNNKTTSIKEMSRRIVEEYGGVIPADHEALMTLSGIGRKCADIIMTTLYDVPGVAVDTHVHRLANRLGVVETATHVQTADALNDITPREFARHAHEWLIQHGSQVCVARTPRCGVCPLADLCAWWADSPEGSVAS